MKIRQQTMAKLLSFAALCTAALPSIALARDVEYQNEEVLISVTPGEPTQIKFPGVIAGGFKKKLSKLSIDRKDTDLIVFANDALDRSGEAMIVRLEDGRSYSMRIQKASETFPRDTVVSVLDKKSSIIGTEEEEDPLYKEKKFEYAPPTQVSGLMREMVLVAEFGKSTISGYKTSETYRGQSVLNDGTVSAKIDKIFMGTNLWGYVLDAENLLDTTQKLNPATFRLDGTRAISLQDMELSPRPVDIEQQISAGHNTKVYIVTKAR